MSPKNIFRNPMGKRYLRGLFYEEMGEDKSSVVYTLKREDHQGFPSLYRLYMAIADPTEYRFAVECLDGWSHWQELSSASWFKPFIEEWRHELEVKLRSEALAQILAVSRDQANNNSYHANKYLLDGSWKPADAKKRGRPGRGSTRDEIIAHGASLAEMEDDAKRLGLN